MAVLRIGLVFVFALLTSSIARAAEFTIGERSLVVPDGFEIELVAGPPLVDRPISISRDELGRLYVTDSAGMSDRADKQLVTKPHRIVRLEDKDGDGKYDTSTVFADKMMFPEGCLWYAGSLYVAAPPQIWKLTDADNDGVAEKREVWFDGQTLTGCANDLHGPYLGHDGWLYWCKGAFAEQKHKLPNGKEFVTKASHIFRARPDGTGMEPVLTGGMDNPVGLAFLSTGERILSCTFFQHPADGKRDGLIHAIYGGVYGKKHDPIYAHPMTGDVMPVMTHMGAAAPAGLIAGSEVLFGGGHLDNLFACYFNLHKVVRHELTPTGATYKTKEFDFVSCEHPDFHPTDVFEDADGSLLVVDTGGWYKVCCPTSQIAKPDVLGAIYRVRKTGQPKVEDPLGLAINWKEADVVLMHDLTDARLFVQRRAMHKLRSLGPSAARYLREQALDVNDQRILRQIVWTTCGMDGEVARDIVRRVLQRGDAVTKQIALHAISLHRDKASAEFVTAEITKQKDLAISRVAAEAAGRIGAWIDPSVFAAKVGPFKPDPFGAPSDDAQRVLEHSLIYSQIEQGSVLEIRSRLSSENANIRRAALVALDQMPSGALGSDQVISLLDDKEPLLRNTATWIVSHRPAWGGDLVAYFQKRLAGPLADEVQRDEFAALLSQLAKSPPIQELLAKTLEENASDNARRVVLQAMGTAGLTAPPPAWLENLAELLTTAKEPHIAQVVEVARKLPQPKGGHLKLVNALLAVGKRETVPTQVRLDALRAAGPLPTVDSASFDFLLKQILPAEPLEARSAAADILGKADLNDEQKRKLLAALGEAGPLELPRLLAAFERRPTEPLGRELLAALPAASGFRSLRADTLKAILGKYPQSVQDAGQPLLAQLNVDAAAQAAHLDKLLADLPAGDIRRGQVVFLGKKVACFSCHAMGYLGGRIGPDLTNIGKVRTNRDLLESIVFPSASFVRSYESTQVLTHDGQRFEGIISKETADEVVLVINEKLTQPIPRSDIAEQRPGRVSIMPQGVDKAITPQELADLVTFLKNVAP